MFRELSNLKIGRCLAAFAFSGVQAFGMYHIHAQADVTEGGIFGLALLLEYWLGLSPAVTTFVPNAACYLLGWRTLGIPFVVYSLLAATGYSVTYGICQQFPPLWPDIGAYPLAAALVGALFIGIGAGICVRAGGAASGDDALAMSISRLTGVGVERVYLVSDLTILALSLSYIPWNRIAYSLLTVILSGQLIGWIQKAGTRKWRSIDK